jgi:hypothetical protein
MKPDGFLRAWTVILGTGGRFPPEHMDTFPGIGTKGQRRMFSPFTILTTLMMGRLVRWVRINDLHSVGTL